MPEIRLTRVYRFASSHRLHAPELSDGENARVYGKCNNPFGHGHDYVLEVTLAGAPDPVTGRLLPLAVIDEIVSRVILIPMDRRNLNTEIAEFASLVPTTENLAVVAASRITAAWAAAGPPPGVRLDRIRIHETRNNIFEVSLAGDVPDEPENRT
jgi:6-pyruvoyltetrahydropterin/6-carboxytetrahydropterin synthase